MTGISPVAWTNRERDDGHFLAGDYYVLYGAEIDSPTSVELPYTITVEVQGEETGEPTYAAPGELITSSDLVAPDGVSPPAGQSEGSPTDSSDTPPAEASDPAEPGTPGWVVPAVVGAGVLVLLVAALGLVVRRRRTS
jgi:hypothetical protein